MKNVSEHKEINENCEMKLKVTLLLIEYVFIVLKGISKDIKFNILDLFGFSNIQFFIKFALHSQ